MEIKNFYELNGLCGDGTVCQVKGAGYNGITPSYYIVTLKDEESDDEVPVYEGTDLKECIKSLRQGGFTPRKCDPDFIPIKPKVKTDENNGGNTDYYNLPAGSKILQDIIEHKKMNFSVGNIFKAAYRLGECSHSDSIRDLNKIVWFAQREINRLK